MPTDTFSPGRLRRFLAAIRAAHRRESDQWIRRMERDPGTDPRRRL
jgi:hypothetical protein